MQTVTGTIKNVRMNAMVRGVLSWVDIDVDFPPNGYHTITEKDTIENLKKTFGFEITNDTRGDIYDVRQMIGRKCEIQCDPVYRFIRYI